MNVRGSASSTSSGPSVIFAVRACHFAELRNVTRCRFANSAVTLKPTLCLVSEYSDPGLPSPTISFNVVWSRGSTPTTYRLALASPPARARRLSATTGHLVQQAWRLEPGAQRPIYFLSFLAAAAGAAA